MLYHFERQGLIVEKSGVCIMEYFVIIMAVLCFALQFAFTKAFEGVVKQTAVTSLIMLLFTNLIGVLLFLCVGGFKVGFSLFSLLWATVFAVIMIPYYMIGIKVLSIGSLAIYSMFMMLGGMLVPYFYGICFLAEDITWGKVVGCVLLTGFIILQTFSQKSTGSEEKNKSKRMRFLFFALCLIIFFINGMTGVIAKVHQIGENAVSDISFTVLSCAITAILSGVMLGGVFLVKPREEKWKLVKSCFHWKPLLTMALLGMAAYSGNFLQLKAASKVPASVQFPLVSGGVIVLSALFSVFIFKEKLTKKEWISVAGAFLATFFFAF